MTGNNTLIDLGRTQMNADPIRNLSASINAACPRCTLAATVTETVNQFMASLPDRQRINGVVNRFLAHLGIA